MQNVTQNKLQSRQIGIVVVLALGSLALHLYFSWRPLASLVAMFAGDDMFYYLQIARNIARGHGSTFDGTTLTNGYHPVYMLLVTAIFWLFPGKTITFYAQASLTLLSVANVTTGVLLFFVVKRLFGRSAGLFAAMFWLLNPYVLGTALIGVEVALAALMFSIAMLVYLRFSEQWMMRQARWQETYLLGVLLGLTCLCRTDSMFFAFCLGLAILFILHKSPHTPGSWKHWPIFIVGGATVIGPWFAWNLLRFGSIVQDSARALTSLKHHLYLQTYGWQAVITKKWPATFTHWISCLTDILCMPTSWFTALLLLLLVWVALRPTLATQHPAHSNDSFDHSSRASGSFAPRADLPQRAMLWAVLGALVLTLLFYAGYFWFLQKWYFLSPTVLVVVLLGGLFHTTEQNIIAIGVATKEIQANKPDRSQNSLDTLPLKQSWIQTYKHLVVSACMVFLVLGLFVWQGNRLFRVGFYPWQKQYYNIAIQLKQMPKTTRVGAFNTGIYGYVMDRGVVNLDGVVNGQVLRAMKQKKLLSYLRQQGITHIVDHLHAIQHFATFAESVFRDSFALRGRYRVATTGGDVVLLELIPPKK